MVLTHANLIANIDGATQAGGFNENDTSLSWMPLTHDMGLIGFHLVMFANRVHSNLMPTELFVRRPLLWLSIASQQRATITVLAELRLSPLPQGAGRALAREPGSLAPCG